MKFLLLALTALSLSQAPAQAASALRCNLVATNNSSITVKLTVAGGITSFFNSKKKLAPGASTSYSYSTAGISQYGPIPVTVTDSRLLQGRILGGFIGQDLVPLSFFHESSSSHTLSYSYSGKPVSVSLRVSCK